MKAEDIHGLIRLGGDALKECLIRAYAIMATPRVFFSSIKPETTEELVHASIFVVFGAIAITALDAPTRFALGIDIDSSIILTDVVEVYAFCVLFGSIFHLCIKLMGGTGSYQSSLVVCFYLTIFFVINKVVRLPADLWWKRLIVAYEGDILSPDRPY